jgi:hypothetical protein
MQMVRARAMINKMKHDGRLRDFNARYKAGGAAALAEGKGFMSYGNAIVRLKRALIPMLQTGQPIAGVFNQVFR